MKSQYDESKYDNLLQGLNNDIKWHKSRNQNLLGKVEADIDKLSDPIRLRYKFAYTSSIALFVFCVFIGYQYIFNNESDSFVANQPNQGGSSGTSFEEEYEERVQYEEHDNIDKILEDKVYQEHTNVIESIEAEEILDNSMIDESEQTIQPEEPMVDKTAISFEKSQEIDESGLEYLDNHELGELKVSSINSSINAGYYATFSTISSLQDGDIIQWSLIYLPSNTTLRIGIVGQDDGIFYYLEDSGGNSRRNMKVIKSQEYKFYIQNIDSQTANVTGWRGM